jgi:hypothetical protein
LRETSVKWGQIFHVNIFRSINLVDSDLRAPLSGKTVTFTGTATTGTPIGTTTQKGNLTSAVNITASTNVGPGNTVIGNFAGDANYISSSSPPATITINAHITALTLGTLTDVPWGGPTSFPITLTDTDNGATPIQGKTISFNGTGVIGVSSQITNSAGQATGTGTAPSTVGNTWTVQAHFGGDSLYLNKDGTITQFATLRHGTTITLTISPSTVVHGSTYQVTGVLGDAITGTPISSQTITFNATSPIVIGSATTNSTGTYTVSGLIAPSTPNTYNITAKVGGNSLYLSSLLTRPLTVT